MNRHLTPGTKVRFMIRLFISTGEITSRQFHPEDDRVTYGVRDRQGWTCCVTPTEIVEVLS